jgi:hypothetical protein
MLYCISEMYSHYVVRRDSRYTSTILVANIKTRIIQNSLGALSCITYYF